MRVFAISDLHVDHQANREWVQQLSESEYTNDVLIIAGDISDDWAHLENTLQILQNKFSKVFFVPGNHELWIRRGNYPHSIGKFEQILLLCQQLGIFTNPQKIGQGENDSGLWIIPLFSWYTLPEEGGNSLFITKPGNDRTMEIWNDFHCTQWPDLGQATLSEYFLGLNASCLEKKYEAPVISFSHFLPRQDLIFSTEKEREGAVLKDPHPYFNFSRVAGCRGLEQQIRKLGSTIHVYGHQHRNRDRMVDGVRYISCCLGYPRERARSTLKMPGFGEQPMMILSTIK
ncbi:MAG: metallophosphoesterase [SAR324 cluster bacterium]|nr:metallophosphoesterase [SAR324 cluster bacterium]